MIPLPNLDDASFDKPLALLAACHGRVESQCRLLEKLAQHARRHGGDTDACAAARRILHYFDTAARHHHQDEECDMFPLLEATAAACAPLLADLRAQHRVLEGHWAALRPQLQALAAGDGGALLPATVTAFLTAYRAHVAQEDAQLLPLAARLLQPAQLAKLGRSMARRRRRRRIARCAVSAARRTHLRFVNEAARTRCYARAIHALDLFNPAPPTGPVTLADRVNTFGQAMLRRYGERVHKIALDAGLTCPNRDGSKGLGGCTFCNNASFNPAQAGARTRLPAPLARQIESGRAHIARRTGARRFIAYFQTYTNTYDSPERLRALYDAALAEPDMIGLCVGTRPDCVPDAVLALLADYRERGFAVWLELGLQSSFDATLAAVNRGHGFAEYRDAMRRAHRYRLPVCTHLIVGLPGESGRHARISLDRVLDAGTHGLKLHPLHVVRGTQLARDYRHGRYRPLECAEYVAIAADLIVATPPEVVFHRLTGTAPAALLLAPAWCSGKWPVLNAIERELAARGARQGAAARARTALA